MLRYSFDLLLFGLFALLLGVSLSSTERMTFLFENASYFIIFFLLLLWTASAVRLAVALGVTPGSVWRQGRAGAACALLLTAVVVLSVETDFRTLSDETNLLAVSSSMAFRKNIRNMTQGKYYYDNFQPLSGELPKRPFVYPFLTSLLHGLLGFQPANAFIVNYAVFFLFLTGVFVLVSKILDKTTALAALLLICSYPVVTLYVASGGFDFVNAFFFYLSFASLWFYLRQPSKEKFEFMWVSFLVLANVRYESVVYFLIAVAGLAVFRHITWRTVKTHATLFCLTPLLMLPFIWQRVLLQGSYQNPSGVALFDLQHFFDHGAQFLQAQFSLAFYLPYANIINLAALGCLAVLLLRLAQGGLRARFAPASASARLQFWMIFSAAIATNLVLVLSHYFGRYEHPSSARFFIIPCVFFPLVLIGFRKVFPARVRAAELLSFALVMFLLYHPIAVEDRFTETLTLNREFRQTRQLVESLHDKRLLVVTDPAGAVHGAGLRRGRFWLRQAERRGVAERAGPGAVFPDRRYSASLLQRRPAAGRV